MATKLRPGPEDRTVQTTVMRRVREGWRPAARHSGLEVHAAALATHPDGQSEVRTGGNVENGLRSLTMCAERATIAGLLQDDPEARLESIAVWSRDRTLPPCCACRQAIHDASEGRATVNFLENGRWVTRSIADLLPDAPDLTPLRGGPPPPRGVSPLLDLAIEEHARSGLAPSERVAVVRTANGSIHIGFAVHRGPNLNAEAVTAAVWDAVNSTGGAETTITEVAVYAPTRVASPDGYERGVIEEFGPQATVTYTVANTVRTRTLDQLLPERRVKGPAVAAPERAVS